MVDAIILYEPTETAFNTNGLGSLSDAVSCIITEERNGEFELEMTYQVSGSKYNLLSDRCIILAKPNPYDRHQPFRIYRISKPLNRVVTINARHISYDLSGIPVSPFTAGNVSAALGALKSGSAISNPFNFMTDKSTTATMNVKVPSSVRALLGGNDGSILDTYGGEYKFDRYDVHLYSHRGNDNGVSIRYGKNLTDIEQERNISNTYTGVYPYWYSENDGLVELSGKILKASGTYDYEKILPLDLTSEFEDKPSADQLKSRAEQYMTSNNIGIPSVSLTVSFVSLLKAGEIDTVESLEKIQLCDYVSVEFPQMNISANAKCIKTTYDAIQGRYTSIELGDAKSNLADTIANVTKSISNVISKSDMDQAIYNATALITGGLGGYIILHSSRGKNGIPDELLCLGSESNGNISQAKNVWRFNKNGFAHSSKGYNGPYEDIAITMDGHINGKFITGLVITAQMLKGLALTLGGGSTGGGGSITIYDAAGNQIGSWDVNGLKATKGSLSGDLVTGGTIIGSAFKNSASYPTFSVDSKGYVRMTAANIGGFEVTASSFKSSSSDISAKSYGTGSGSMDYYDSSLRLVANGGGMIINGTRITPVGTPRLGYRDNPWQEVYANYLWSGGSLQVSSNGMIEGWLTVEGATYARGSLTVDGDLSVGGEKNRIVKTANYGTRKLSAYETATPYFADIGEGMIDANGKCYIYLDDVFSETIDSNCTYQVFLQPYGKNTECTVLSREKSYFVVSGTPNSTFAWEIKGVQNGYNLHRLDAFDMFETSSNNDMYDIDSYMRYLDGAIQTNDKSILCDEINIYTAEKILEEAINE